jgi:hypothetical protein
MDRGYQKLWIRPLILVGLFYIAAGLGFGALAGASGSDEMRIIWRWAAWVASAVAFALHIWYEYYRLRSSPLAAASHVSGAVALGALALAIAASTHALLGGQGGRRLLLLSLVLWPLITAVPAYVVAWGLTTLLARKKDAG